MDKVTQPGLGDLLKNRGALIGTAMFLFQQLAGINAIIYFSSDVFAKVSPAKKISPALNTRPSGRVEVGKGPLKICFAKGSGQPVLSL